MMLGQVRASCSSAIRRGPAWGITQAFVVYSGLRVSGKPTAHPLAARYRGLTWLTQLVHVLAHFIVSPHPPRHCFVRPCADRCWPRPRQLGATAIPPGGRAASKRATGPSILPRGEANRFDARLLTSSTFAALPPIVSLSAFSALRYSTGVVRIVDRPLVAAPRS